jgi:hypothetical protein
VTRDYLLVGSYYACFVILNGLFPIVVVLVRNAKKLLFLVLQPAGNVAVTVS